MNPDHPEVAPRPASRRRTPPKFHRALRRLTFPPSRWLTVVLLPVAFNFACWLGLEHVTDAWQSLFATWLQWLGLGAAVPTERIAMTEWLVVELPQVTVRARAVDEATWVGVLLTSLAGLLTSFLVPKRYIPLRYFLRFAVMTQLAALAFFALTPGAFQHTVTSHVRDGLLLTLFLVALVPWLHSLTYYIFDFSIAKKAALTLLTICYLLLLAPFQYLTHVWLLHHFSYLTMPTLFLLFGVPLQILAFVALYGWGMSWDCPTPTKTARTSRLAEIVREECARHAWRRPAE